MPWDFITSLAVSILVVNTATGTEPGPKARPKPMLTPTESSDLTEAMVRFSKLSLQLKKPDCKPEPEVGLELERSQIVDNLGRELPISVIGKDKLQELTELYPKKFRAKHQRYCLQRAHTLGDSLAKAGIETQKLLAWPKNNHLLAADYIHPLNTSLRDQFGHSPSWEFHVVNLIKVKDEKGEVSLYVIDPLTSSVPVPMEEWRSNFRRADADGTILETIGKTEVINRVKYEPEQRNSPITEYDPKTLTYAYQIMAGNDDAILDK